MPVILGPLKLLKGPETLLARMSFRVRNISNLLVWVDNTSDRTNIPSIGFRTDCVAK